MAEKYKTREITITDEEGSFDVLFKLFKDEKKYDFGGLALFRKVLSNEKARLMNILKTKKPKSIYELAKMLKRDFKGVSEDIKLLEKLGFVDMIAEKSGRRERLRPVLVVDSLYVRIKV